MRLVPYINDTSVEKLPGLGKENDPECMNEMKMTNRNYYNYMVQPVVLFALTNVFP